MSRLIDVGLEQSSKLMHDVRTSKELVSAFRSEMGDVADKDC